MLERSNATVRWRGDEVETHEGRLDTTRQLIPVFERRPFALPRGEGQAPAVNIARDVIVRVVDQLPVGIVSKQYRLVQHSQVFDLAVEALKQAKIASTDVACHLTLTKYGERMALRVHLPKNYGLDPGDGNSMGLCFRCFNSVDGSTRFMAVVGWIRFVCLNGLIVGTATARLRGRHDSRLDVEDVGAVFREGLRLASDERAMYREWVETELEKEQIRKWVNGPLARKWGRKAAARAHHIIETGYDARLIKPFERTLPSDRTIAHGVRVPGSVAPARNAFAVSQALAWLAKERRDVEEQLEWSRQVHELMKHLLG